MQSLAERTDEITQLKTQWSSNSATVSAQHLQEISTEREKSNKVRYIMIPGLLWGMCDMLNF